MAQRSVILGYNHNIGYRGLVFHVQTEDSGVDNPHVFTHMFHGGVILTTSKLEYDADASEDAVKALMQSQHKTILKKLKRGEYDEKIDAYLGSHPDLKPPGAEPEKLPSKPPAQTRIETTPAPDPAPTPAPFATVEATRRPQRDRRPSTAGPTRIQPAPPPVASTLSKRAHSEDSNVLVSAAPIVVASGRDGALVDANTPRPIRRARPRVVREEPQDSIFDQNLITEKSLDEVILAYLSEDAED